MGITPPGGSPTLCVRRIIRVIRRISWRSTGNPIELYEGRDECYAFPTIEELNNIFSTRLEPVSVTIPVYNFGQCCPILAYRNRVKKIR